MEKDNHFETTDLQFLSFLFTLLNFKDDEEQTKLRTRVEILEDEVNKLKKVI